MNSGTWRSVLNAAWCGVRETTQFTGLPSPPCRLAEVMARLRFRCLLRCFAWRFIGGLALSIGVAWGIAWILLDHPDLSVSHGTISQMGDFYGTDSRNL